MMGLFDPYVIIVEAVHQSSQVVIQGEKQVDPQAEVRRVEEGLPLFLACFFYLIDPVEPPRGARYNRYAGLERVHVILERARGRGELDGHIGAPEPGRLKLILFIHIDDRDDLVPSFAGYSFDLASHLAVSY